VNLTECEIRSVLFGPHGRVEEWNLTAYKKPNSSKEISYKDLIVLIFYNNYIYIDLYSKSELD
jgi:hypothetical protein